MIGYSESVNELFSTQLTDWELARVNYSLLTKVKTRELDFGEFRIFVQFNPERMRSSVAKVDAKSIEARPCFLCAKNRPSQQSGISLENDLILLVNPFPIFARHLTIPSELHIDQRIENNFGNMLRLAEAIPDFVIFYNGPQCGASAPDHFHFQAGNKGFLPVETDFSERKFAVLISKKSGVELWHWTNYLRGIMTLKGTDKAKLIQVFNHFFQRFSDFQPDKPEPMLNILAYYYPDGWVIHLIPRKIHRPDQFFLEGEDQILLSPASVDLGGVIITPREEDFNKISELDVADIFRQVCFDENETMEFFRDLI
jgi:ATP adenylyltransferase/5',5'''-P-1,P-4-tetraphosphate phosphorylase II